MKWLIACLAVLLVAGCATAPSAGPERADALDEIAADYVRLMLVVGERDEGFVDAYYGPSEWREAARADSRDLDQLAIDLAALEAATVLDGGWDGDRLTNRRAAFLRAQLRAAQTRLAMVRGQRLPFEQEARELYGVTPELRPLADFDPLLARLERTVPGEGTLAERVAAFQEGFVVPPDRLEAVMRAAIAECRRRTLAHIALPSEESFTLEFVAGRNWSGYNWYQGGYRSLIQVNTDIPVRIGRAVDLGCHEGYPGHHAYNVLLERDLARGRGWIEYTLYPLYSPQSFIAEGTANYGIELAFPGAERLAFERDTLYPLAGLPPERAAAYFALQEALGELDAARFTIARDYLDGRIGRDEAIALTERYVLVPRARAEQQIAFADQYRSYVINYGLGRDMVARHIEAAGPAPAARWAAMRRLLSEPTLPSDLAR